MMATYLWVGPMSVQRTAIRSREQYVRWMMIEWTIVVKCVGRRSTAAAAIVIIIIEYSFDICVRNKPVFAFGFSEWI